jgi:hypothetical protein
LFFRKVVNDNNNPNCDNQWFEVATRNGTNTFTQLQYFNQGIHTPLGQPIQMGDVNNINRQISINYMGDGSGGDGYLSYSRNFYIMNVYVKDYIVFQSNGNVSIGQGYASEKLEVNGTIRAKEIKVESSGWSGWPDFVFSENYKLPSLSDVKTHIQENQHLPGIPSANDVKENGIGLGELGTKLLQKVEELTLYVIQQQETINELTNKITELENSKK